MSGPHVAVIAPVVLEPVMIRGERKRTPRPDDIAVATPELSNRAAGRARAEAEAPDDAGFGGFAYERTGQDEADVVRAALASRFAPSGAEATTQGDAEAIDRVADAPQEAGFGDFAYERTAQDEADVARGSAPVAEPAPTAGPAVLPVVPDEATAAPESESGGEPGRAGAPVARVDSGATVLSGVSPQSVTSPDELVVAVRTAADALPHGAPEPAPLSAVFDPQLSEAQVRAARRRHIGGSGRFPPPRPIDPIEIDPVPAATEAISMAVNARLPELALPAPKPMPDRTIPHLIQPASASADDMAVTVPLTQPGTSSASVNAAEAQRTKTATATAAAPITEVAEPAPVPVEPPVLVDFRREPTPPLPQAQAELETGQITQVLAIILASVPERARAFVQTVRDEAFPPDKMANYQKELTEPLATTAQVDLTAHMQELQVASGVAQASLDAAIALRRQELNAHVQHVAAEGEVEVQRSAVQLSAQAQQENARIEAAKRRDEAHRVQKLRLALHSRDPALVEELVTQRLTYIGTDVARGVVAIEAASTHRITLIEDYRKAYLDAYRRADDAFQATLPGGKRQPANQGDRLWYDVADDELTLAMRALTDRTTREATGLVTALQDAGLRARAAVHEWADTRVRRPALSAEQAQARSAADATTQAGEVAAAQVQSQKDGVRNRLVGEIRFATAAYLQTQDDTRQVSVQRAVHLDADQMKIGQQFLSAGGPQDPMSAVAAGLVGRYQQQHLAEQVAALRAQVYAIVPKTTDEADQLGDIYFPGPPGDLKVRVSKLWRAFEVWHGTAEEDAINALTGVDGPAMALLNAAYQLAHGETLRGRIDSEMSGSDFDQADGLAGNDGSATASTARARHARGVIADSDGWFSNDPTKALDAIRALPPGEAVAVAADPAARKHLTTVLGGRRWIDQRGTVTDERGESELQFLLDINRMSGVPGRPVPGAIRDLQAKADAVELDRYVRRGTGGDAPDIEQLFTRIRASVVADPVTSAWSADEVDNEVRRRTRAMENAYEHLYAAELPNGGVSALRTAMARGLWGTRREIAVDLLDVNRAGARASRLQQTTEGVYTSDSEMNTELERTYKDAVAEVRRADSYRGQVEKRAQELMTQDGITTGGRRPGPREIEAYRREATDEVARDLARTWMSDTSREFGNRYASRWGGDAQDALRTMLVDTTQFTGEKEALARLSGGGGLSSAQSVQFGVAGWGMDRDPVVGALSGRTRQQIARIGDEYATNTGGENMMGRLQEETGGWTADTADTDMERDGFDIREATRGIPITAGEEHAAATRRFEYERDVYFKDNPYERDSAVGPELALLQETYSRATDRFHAYESAVRSGDEAEIRRAEAAVRATGEAVNTVADHYREAVDAYVDRTAQIAAVAAAITVAVLVTFVTAGAAGPVVVGLAASVAGTAASIATKQGVLGAAYSRHALTNDVIVGVVDAVVTVLTARLGNILLKLPKPTGTTSALMKASVEAIEAQRLAKPLLHRVAASAAEQIGQAVPTAVAGSLLDRGTWRGDPLRNVASAAGMAGMVGVGIGTTVHGLTTYGPKLFGVAVDALRAMRSGSGAEIAADRVLLRSTSEALAAGELPRDALARRGSPVERLAARRKYLSDFPGSTHADFERALAQGTADAAAGAEAVREVRREMMRHFMEGIPAAERGKFVDTPIIMMPDAEFIGRTGSDSRGNAVTLIIDGKPVVVLREGAPLSALREEGMHARQIKDALNAERVGLLDERTLAQWASTSLEDRVAAWHAKLDLELEVQTRLMAELDEELSRPGLSPERAAELVDRFEDAHAALEVLSGRRATLIDLDLDAGALDRIRAGQLDPPPFLVEQPRLFSKKAKGKKGVSADAPFRVIADKEFKEGSRRSRWVREYDKAGNLVQHYLQRHGSGGWRKSGLVGTWGGGVAEVAMRMEHADLVGTDLSGVKRVQLDAQTSRGWGFDDVMPEFTREGGKVRAVIVVSEGKDYAGAVSKFSAIDKNFTSNLQRLRSRMRHLLTSKTWAAVGLDEAEVRAAIKAVDEYQVRVEVRTSDSTHIAEGMLEGIETRLQKISNNISVKRGPNISAASITDAERWWATMEHYRIGGKPGAKRGMTAADSQLFRYLAQLPTGISPKSMEIAETVVLARRAHPDAIEGVVLWEPQGKYLVDGKGRPFEVFTAGRDATGFDPEAEARTILGLANRSVVPPGFPSSQPMRVVVDFGEIGEVQTARLLRALARQAKSLKIGPLERRVIPMFHEKAATRARR